MFQEIDCRGLACPQPVINAKKALEKIAAGTIITIVDNEAAKENLLKFAKGMSFSAEVQPQDDSYKVVIHKGEHFAKAGELELGLPNNIQNVENTYSILITSNVLGRGNDELGAVLIKSLFYTLTEQDNLPTAIAFLNSGVYLTCENSPVLEHVINLESRGTEILSCGTCLDFYKIKDKLCVGSVSNMYTILDTLQKAEKVITL